jgi:hypothetical protein
MSCCRLSCERMFTSSNCILVADGSATSEGTLYSTYSGFIQTDVLSSQYSGGNEHLVRHPSRPRGKHTKADAGEDKHVITVPDGEGLLVVRYISNLSGKTSALSQCASRYNSEASLYIRFGGGSVLAVVSSSQLQYIRGADGEHV